ncbi:MAG TPA: DPP IV N-terminal domain-containing protein [Thermoanaerobaculia bacterium]|nr:DPP IV N-terminal domain-containing protein [Thermoanaerobaculia bacterium]
MRLASPALALLLLAGAAATRAEETPAAAVPRLTVDWLYGEEIEDWARPSEAVWTSDGKVLLLDGSRPEAERTFERVDPETGRRTRLVDPAQALSSLTALLDGAEPPEALEWPESRDGVGRLGVWVHGGDLYLLRFADSTFERLTATEAEESLPRLAPDGSKLAFVRGNDLWLLDLAGKTEKRLTSDGSDTILNGNLSWVYGEEIFTRSEGGIAWSPDSTAIAFLRTDESPVAVSTFVDFEPWTPRVIEQRYPKAGTANPIVRLGILDLASGRTAWLDPSTVPYEYIWRYEWLADSSGLGVVTLNRAQDRADLWRVGRDGAARHVLTRTDPAWVNQIDFHFLAGAPEVVATQQDTGWTHVSRYSLDGAKIADVTAGEWSVRGPAAWQDSTIATTIDEARGLAYFTARRPDLGQLQLYRIGLDGSGLERISTEPGTHVVDWSDDRDYYLDRHSSYDAPPTLTLRHADGSAIAVLEEHPLAGLAPVVVRTPERLTVPAADGQPLQARLYKPADFDPARAYPLIVYVYGEPNAPTVTDRWATWPPPGAALYEQILLQEGFLVAAIDSRVATAETKAMENLVFRKVSAEIEVADLAAGVRWFKAQPWVDADRVGIWGWSGGGTSTLLMMTRSQEFRAGIAVAAAADRRTYDTKYTEPYMRTPEANAEGYEAVSLVSRAKDLHGRLLLVHGTYDDNVHPQNAWMFVDALVEAGKPFDLMIYPMRQHGIADLPARRHLFQLMIDFWKRELGGESR